MVLTREEAKSVFSHLHGADHLFLALLYGTGMRLTEGLRLRVKDVDFSCDHILIRDGKGAKDRVTMLPASLKPLLVEHLKVVKRLHEKDLQAGFGRGQLPFALERKYPQAEVRCRPKRTPLRARFRSPVDRHGVGFALLRVKEVEQHLKAQSGHETDAPGRGRPDARATE